MDTRYQTLLDELHVNKRQLANYRQKYLNMENQLLALQQNHRNLKKSLSVAQQNNQKLTEQNKFLTAQKQNLQLQYSTSVQSIKDQISKKQQQIFELRQNTYSPMSNQKLVQKQIKCEVQAQFSQIIQNKDKRIKQLQQQIEKLSFEKNIEAQKYSIKVQGLEKQVKQMQNQHMIQIQNYAQRTYQSSQLNKVSQEQVLIRKLRREIDELRITLNHTQQQLSESIHQKGRIQKQFSSVISKHNQQIHKYAEQLRARENQQQRNSEIQIKSRKEIDQTSVREKQKEIRNLKDKIEDLHQKLKKKQNKISELEVQLVSKTAQLQKVRDFNSKHQNEKIQQLKLEKQRVQRQMKELRYVNETIRKQNVQLLSTISQTNIKSTKNIMEAERQYQKQTVQKRRVQKQTKIILTQGMLENQDDVQINNKFIQSTQPNGLIRVKSSTNFEKENDSKQKYKFLLEEERLKNQELSRKYVQLKKKYKNLETKLQQANAKLVNLLKDKIQLGSPTAASKKSFDFPSSPNNAPFFKSPQADRQFNRFTQTVNHSRTNFNNVSGSRNIRFSPQNIDQMRQPPRDKSQNEKELSFYEKSLRVRSSHKFKEIKCLNHDDPQHDHQKCGHSPFAK